MVDIEEGQDIVDLFVHRPGRKRVIASSKGDGFIVAEDELIANTRKGKQVLNVAAPTRKRAARARRRRHGRGRSATTARCWSSRSTQLPEMGRGKGVRLQKYKDGGLSDLKTFPSATGLTWTDSSGRTYTKTASELTEWLGERASAGRQPPTGFPRNNRFVG